MVEKLQTNFEFSLDNFSLLDIIYTTSKIVEELMNRLLILAVRNSKFLWTPWKTGFAHSSKQISHEPADHLLTYL